MNPKTPPNAESRRLEENQLRVKNWKRWGPYLSERQWGTVREDYSPTGEAWEHFPHDHARSRAYRWVSKCAEDSRKVSSERSITCFRLSAAPSSTRWRPPSLHPS
jgi:hypothetical protein